MAGSRRGKDTVTDKPLSIAEAADEKQALYLVAQMVRPQQGPAA